MLLTILSFLQGLAFIGIAVSSFYLHRYLKKRKEEGKTLTPIERSMLSLSIGSLIIWAFTFILIQLDIIFA
ncbi:hypothetical protein [Alteribacter aurantiacus]|uniref:hypothetical protein n=1 Tax=Alteribacter aurantiacus TaxID=254410 RepID=UPI0003F57245|nr:hypothetical protein [Alteribacter aurantiacus]